MPKNKKQHVIPKCYLKAWSDPRTPAGQSPYVWRISRDGSVKKKRSAAKTFTSTDRYTIRLPNGNRSLVLEETLSKLEGDFVNALARVRRREKLTQQDRARLCVFAAAMRARPVAVGEHWRETMEQQQSLLTALEKRHGAGPTTSGAFAAAAKVAPQMLLASTLEILPPLLFPMAMSVLITDDELGFITSDCPCVWYNPEAYKMPPIYRSPGLAQQAVEVTLPLSPQHLLFFSHRHEIAEYVAVGKDVVDECNRVTRAHCQEEFVSWKGETRAIWFDLGTPPENARENGPERCAVTGAQQLVSE